MSGQSASIKSSALLLGFTVVIVCSAIAGLASSFQRSTLITPGHSQSISLANVSPSNVSYCELLGPHPGTSADLLTSYVGNVSTLWYKLCSQSTFISIVDTWGDFYLTYFANASSNTSYWAAGNLSVGTGGAINGIPTVSFIVGWITDCNSTTYGTASSPCNYQEYWNGNVSTNNISGPLFREYVVPPTGGGQPKGSIAASPTMNLWVLGVAAALAASLATLVMLIRTKRPPQVGNQSPAPPTHSQAPNVDNRNLDSETRSPSTPSPGRIETGGPDPLEDML
jgi:hypothetical protein